MFGSLIGYFRYMKKYKIYKGSSKTLYETEEEYSLTMSFDDSIRLSNGKIIEIAGKGVLNNKISAHLMQQVEMIGVENHFIEKLNMRQQLIQYVDICPVQVHISTVASGRYVKDFGMERGFVFDKPIIDFRVKNKELNYPAINEDQIVNFAWLQKKELEDIKLTAMRVHDFLMGLFASTGIRMVDIKLEFGRVFNGENFFHMLIDEISPDTCRLWDMKTNEKLCYEIAENNPEKLIEAYKEISKRLDIEN